MSRARKKSGPKKNELPKAGLIAGVAFVVVGMLIGFLVESGYRNHPVIDIRIATGAKQVSTSKAPADRVTKRPSPDTNSPPASRQPQPDSDDRAPQPIPGSE